MSKELKKETEMETKMIYAIVESYSDEKNCITNEISISRAYSDLNDAREFLKSIRNDVINNFKISYGNNMEIEESADKIELYKPYNYDSCHSSYYIKELHLY